MGAIIIVALIIIIRTFTAVPTGEMVGTAAPSLDIDNWITAEAPAAEQLSDSIRVVEFWATWCGPCIDAIPHMKELVEQYPQAYFIALSIEDSPNPVEQAVQEHDINYHVGMADGLQHQFGVEGIPAVFIIDTEGMIVWQGHPMDDQMENTIQQLIDLEDVDLQAEEVALNHLP